MTALLSTRSSAVPLSQNTAPVLDFRCLYTHDLRQKKKRWHDGILRFHTFNSRIMVYDVSRNFIGDKYWREPEAVQDGDELELEKGVLIQVEEATGRTEQDLAPILNQHKPQGDRPAAAPAHLPAAPLAASTTISTAAARDYTNLLKPKSLNALLGTPKGKYGRAILPERSPFQKRHEAQSSPAVTEEGSESVGRPAKRLKTAKDVGNDRENVTTKVLAKETTDPPRLGKTAGTNTPNKGQQTLSLLDRRGSPVSATPPVIDLDTDAAAPVPADHLLPSKTKPKPKKKTAKANEVDEEELCVIDSPARPSPAKSRQESCRKTKKKPLQGSIPSPAVSLENENLPPEDDPTSAVHDNIPPPYTLRFAASKPRRKLMYRDLLPDQPPSRHKGGIAGVPQTRRQSSLGDSLEAIERAQRRRLEERLGKQRSPPCPKAGQDDHLRHVGGSLLDKPSISSVKKNTRITTRPNQRGEGAADGLSNHETSLDPDTAHLDDVGEVAIPNRKDSCDTAEAVSDIPSAALSAHADPPQPSPYASHSNPLHDYHMEHSDTITLDPIAVQDLTISPKVQQQASAQPGVPPTTNRTLPNSKRSPIRKSYSEHNTVSTKSAATMLPAFRKQHSDLSGTRAPRSALNAIPDQALGARAVVPPSIVVREDGVTGPWSREAFDLFGWRPGDPKGVGLGMASKVEA